MRMALLLHSENVDRTAKYHDGDKKKRPAGYSGSAAMKDGDIFVAALNGGEELLDAFSGGTICKYERYDGAVSISEGVVAGRQEA